MRVSAVQRLLECASAFFQRGVEVRRYDKSETGIAYERLQLELWSEAFGARNTSPFRFNSMFKPLAYRMGNPNAPLLELN